MRMIMINLLTSRRLKSRHHFSGEELFKIFESVPSLKLTNIAPENGPFQKETKLVFQPSIFRCESYMLVSVGGNTGNTGSTYYYHPQPAGGEMILPCGVCVVSKLSSYLEDHPS